MFHRSFFCAAVVVGSCAFSATGYAQKTGGGGSRLNLSVPRYSVKFTGQSNGGSVVAPTSLASLPITVTTHHAEDDKKVDFKAEAILVLVPTVVTDKAGKAVHHLMQNDFRIMEDGKQQKIAVFEEIVTRNSRLATPTIPGEFSNMPAGANEPQAVTVIVLDTVNTPYLDQRYGRQQLLKYLAQHVDSSQPVALVMITSRGLQVVQDFTDDPRHLLGVLKMATEELPLTQGDDPGRMAENLELGYAPIQSANAAESLRFFAQAGDQGVASFHQGNAVEITLQAFLDLGWALSGMRGHKSVVWVTGSFPFVLDSPSAVPGGDLSTVYERTFQELNQANVSVYPVDARGLVDPITDISSEHGRTPNTIGARAWLHASTLDTLSQVAAMTGGCAFFNRNDLTTAFQRAMEDSSSYYMLGYYLDTRDRRAGWRKLKVSVDRDATEVRARGGFFVTKATTDPALSRDVDLSYALASPFNATGLPVEVRLLGETGNSKHKDIAFRIHIPPNGMTVRGDNNQFDMDFVAFATAPTSRISASLAQNMHGRVPQEQLATIKAGGFAFEKKLQLAPGQYLLRFVIRDNLSGRVGSVSAPITVQ